MGFRGGGGRACGAGGASASRRACPPLPVSAVDRGLQEDATHCRKREQSRMEGHVRCAFACGGPGGCVRDDEGVSGAWETELPGAPLRTHGHGWDGTRRGRRWRCDPTPWCVLVGFFPDVARWEHERSSSISSSGRAWASWPRLRLSFWASAFNFVAPFQERRRLSCFLSVVLWGTAVGVCRGGFLEEFRASCAGHSVLCLCGDRLEWSVGASLRNVGLVKMKRECVLVAPYFVWSHPLTFCVGLESRRTSLPLRVGFDGLQKDFRCGGVHDVCLAGSGMLVRKAMQGRANGPLRMREPRMCCCLSVGFLACGQGSAGPARITAPSLCV